MQKTGFYQFLTRKTIKNILRAIPEAKSTYRVLGECLGSDLVEAKYQPLFDYVQPPKQHGEPFRVVSADFVTTSDGTGIVHLAPTFGSDDFMVAQKEKLPLMLVKINLENKFQ